MDMNDKQISAVILDYGEVLCHRPSEQDFRRLIQPFGVDAKSFATLWDKNRGAFDRGDLTAETYWSMLAKDAGVQIDAKQLREVCEVGSPNVGQCE